MAESPTYTYTGAFIDELARAGVREVVICPGSRSTPLTLAFAADGRIQKWILVDERSAAFFALGLARRSGSPVALVCTSGTAAANFLPAIAEAHQGRAPLIVLTADRPPELQAVGAPQTMGQSRLYGEHVKWFMEMPLPDDSEAVLRYARFTASRVAAIATAAPMGPVHLNMPFREPLTTAGGETLLLAAMAALHEARTLPQYTVVQPEQKRLSLGPAAYDLLIGATRGLIVVGETRGAGREFAARLLATAERYGFPILADPLANLRGVVSGGARPIAHYDAFLRDGAWTAAHAPDLVLRIGAMPTSKPLLKYLEAHEECPLWLADNGDPFRDPMQRATLILDVAPDALAAMLERYAPARETGEAQRAWHQAWLEADQRTAEVLTREIGGFEPLFEGRVFTELAQLLPDGGALVVGNSMPIRDCDTFLPITERQLNVFGNRGVNGIDGQISTALGIAAHHARAETPVALVVGDLTFYHDLNGLLAAKKYGIPLVIVVINNDGGGIFSFLPQAEHHPEAFEDYFGTPTGLDFSLVTEMYGGTFTRARDWETFRAAVRQGFDSNGLHVIEVPTNRADNVAMHRHLWARVADALNTRG